jgi:hypothetical protein
MKPADSVVELPGKAGQFSGWHSKQRLDLVRSQLNAELETGTGRIPKEIPPETGVRQQATERSFDVALAHARVLTQGSHHAFCRLRAYVLCAFARECVNTHLNVGGTNYGFTNGRQNFRIVACFRFGARRALGPQRRLRS